MKGLDHIQKEGIERMGFIGGGGHLGDELLWFTLIIIHVPSTHKIYPLLNFS